MYVHMCVFYMIVCCTNPPSKLLTAGLWSRSHLMYLQLILSHYRCHCNQSCHSTQGSLSSFLTSQSHLSIVSSLSYLLSSRPCLTLEMYSFLHLLPLYLADPLPCFCLVSDLITYSLSFTLVSRCLAALHLILHFYLDTNKLPILSALICLTFPPPFPHISFFLFVTCCIHPHTTIFSCPAATRNKPSYRSSVTKQKLHCVPVTSAHIFLHPKE